MAELLALIIACISSILAIKFFYGAHARSLKKEVDLLQKNLAESHDTTLSLQKDLQEVTRQRDQTIIAYEKDKEHWLQEKEFFSQTEKRLSDSFQNLTEKMLRSSEKNLSEQTTKSLEVFGKHVSKSITERSSYFDKLEASLKEGITTMNSRIVALTKEHSLLESALKTQNSILSSTKETLLAQTEKLLYALKTPHVRGQWGEVQLRRIVELSGMEPYCDFSAQQTQTSEEEGNIRPDLIIHLPEKKHIIVDAKAPLASYLEALEENDAIERKKKMAKHAKHIWGHINTLSNKQYWKNFNSPEFVVLFLPGDPFLSAALEQDPSLLDRACNACVILATPSTLIALLKAIHYGWKNIHISENIRDVLEISSTLLQRTSAFSEHFQKIGKSIDATHLHFNKAVRSFETRLLPSARKLNEIGASLNEETPKLKSNDDI